MKSIFLLSVCVASISINFARQPGNTSPKSNQDVMSGLAKIRHATKAIEKCLGEQSLSGNDSDSDSDTSEISETNSNASRRSNPQTEVLTSVEHINAATLLIEQSLLNNAVDDDLEEHTMPKRVRRREANFGPKPRPAKISVTPPTEIQIEKTPQLNQAPIAERSTEEPSEPAPEQEPEFLLNATEVNAFVKSVYSKAIAEIKAGSSITLADDADSFPEYATLALQIQIILDPQQVIYDEFAVNFKHGRKGPLLRKALTNAFSIHQDLIDEHATALKTPRGKRYRKILERTLDSLKTQVLRMIEELIYVKNSTNGLELTALGATLINDLSIQLAKNGVFRQSLVNIHGNPEKLKSAVKIISESPQDKSIIQVTELLSVMVLHRLDLSTLEIVFDESLIGSKKSGSALYILREKSIQPTQFIEKEAEIVMAQQKTPVRVLSASEVKELVAAIVAAVNRSLHDAKLRSGVLQPLLIATTNLKPNTEIEGNE